MTSIHVGAINLLQAFGKLVQYDHICLSFLKFSSLPAIINIVNLVKQSHRTEAVKIDFFYDFCSIFVNFHTWYFAPLNVIHFRGTVVVICSFKRFLFKFGSSEFLCNQSSHVKREIVNTDCSKMFYLKIFQWNCVETRVIW